MTINAYPFEGQPTTEAQYSRLFRELRGTGIAASADSNAYQVSIDDATHARVKPGFAIIQGFAAELVADEVVPLTAAPFNSYRNDRIVLRLDLDLNTIAIKVLEGDPGSAAIPVLTQTTAGIYDLPLATLKTTYGASAVVTNDERVFCGQDGGAWPTSKRPSSPRLGQSGFNTTLKRWEFWDGTTWSTTYPKSAAEQMTQAQRDALTGADLFAGRMIMNTTANRLEVYSGTGWVFSNPVDVQTFTASGTWTKPSGAKTVTVIALGAGGGGGSGYSNNGTATQLGGGGGGGGGARTMQTFAAETLPATVPVTVGAGGAGGPANLGTNGSNGGAGGDSSFGQLLTAFGGGGGGAGNSSYGFGGGGGGDVSAGNTAQGGVGGGLRYSTDTISPVLGSANGGADAVPTSVTPGPVTVRTTGWALSGGGGGGPGAANNGIPQAGGSSVFGGPGGGGGAGTSSTSFLPRQPGGDGGKQALMFVGGGAAGGAGTSTTPFPGADGSNGASGIGMSPGTGGGGASAPTYGTNGGGKGGNGGTPAAGGGGGAVSQGGTGNSAGGKGGDGRVMVITYF